MARCPFADWRPISVESSARRIDPWGVVMHTAVSNSDALRPWSSVEWHFYVGEQGQLTQFRDTEIEADCQLDGNYFNGRGHISIETWDGAGRVWNGNDVGDIPRWTDKQVATIGRLLAWLNRTHGIPLKRITAWNGRGLGYHRQFTRSSYPRWNESHACPGNRRINQIDDLLAAAKRAGEPKEWFDMFDSKAELAEFIRKQVRLELDKFGEGEVKLGPTQQRITGQKSRTRNKLWSGAWAQSYDAARDEDADDAR